MSTLATQNKIYLSFATRDTSRFPDLANEKPADIARAAVVGLGTMGTGIVQALIAAGVPVAVMDQNESGTERAVQRIKAAVHKRVEQGKLAPQRAEAMLGLLTPAAQWSDLAGADLIIEAVFEDAALKREVLGHVEEVCPPHAIIGSNTSTISLDVLAGAMRRPERLVGMHFFNPAQRMPLVEIIRREATSPNVVATALAFARKLRKTPVLVRNREGFLVSRLFVPYVKEALWLLEEGAEGPAIDAAMVEFGFPMGPLALIDMTGLDILVSIDKVLGPAFPRHGPLSAIATRLVEEGHLGQKTGSGVYKYVAGDYTPLLYDSAQRIIADVRHAGGRTPRTISQDEITERLVLRMVAEALGVMEEGIASRQADVDVAVVLGLGFPDFRGGVLKYAHDLGLENVLARLRRLTETHGERFSPP